MWYVISVFSADLNEIEVKTHELSASVLISDALNALDNFAVAGTDSLFGNIDPVKMETGDTLGQDFVYHELPLTNSPSSYRAAGISMHAATAQYSNTSTLGSGIHTIHWGSYNWAYAEKDTYVIVNLSGNTSQRKLVRAHISSTPNPTKEQDTIKIYEDKSADNGDWTSAFSYPSDSIATVGEYAGGGTGAGSEWWEMRSTAFIIPKGFYYHVELYTDANAPSSADTPNQKMAAWFMPINPVLETADSLFTVISDGGNLVSDPPTPGPNEDWEHYRSSPIDGNAFDEYFTGLTVRYKTLPQQPPQWRQADKDYFVVTSLGDHGSGGLHLATKVQIADDINGFGARTLYNLGSADSGLSATVNAGQTIIIPKSVFFHIDASIEGDASATYLDTYLFPLATLPISHRDSFPTGAVQSFAMQTPPVSWLECNGQQLNISDPTYQKLYLAIGTTYNLGGDPEGTFRVPDLRGQFIRGYDERLPDNGGNDKTDGLNGQRVFGKGQGDTVQSFSITGSFGDVAHSVARSYPLGFVDYGSGGPFSGTFSAKGGSLSGPEGTNPDGFGSDLGGAVTGNQERLDGLSGQFLGYRGVNFNFNSSSVLNTSPETRSKNVALLYCIKY
jgi:hypothetical protein